VRPARAASESAVEARRLHTHTHTMGRDLGKRESGPFVWRAPDELTTSSRRSRKQAPAHTHGAGPARPPARMHMLKFYERLWASKPRRLLIVINWEGRRRDTRNASPPPPTSGINTSRAHPVPFLWYPFIYSINLNANLQLVLFRAARAPASAARPPIRTPLCARRAGERAGEPAARRSVVGQI
jgi:hypothetical protein